MRMSFNEQNNHLSQSDVCFIPGYAGHCPTLKFKVGKRYGVNTRDIIQDLSKKGLFDNHVISSNLKGFRKDAEFCTDGKAPSGIKHVLQDPKYLIGYEGCIPTTYEYIRFSKSFQPNTEKQIEKISCKSQTPLFRCVTNSYTPICRKVNAKMREYCDRGYRISSEFPPITGYTGHIPGINVTDISVSRSYQKAASLGLSVPHHKDNGEKRGKKT